MSGGREAPSRARRRLGLSILTVGILTIVLAVLWVLDEADGPGSGPKDFAHRRTYDEVKVSVHRTFPIAFAVGLVGLGIAMAGARVARLHDPNRE